MAALVFLDYIEKLNKNDKNIKIQDFNNYILTKTPNKMKMIYSENIEELIKKAPDCIIENLFKNTFFFKDRYN